MLRYEIIPVTHYAQNCTLLWNDETQDAVLIDAGGDVQHIVSRLTDKGLKLVALWQTHGHLDHVGAVSTLQKEYQVPALGPHQADAFWLNSFDMQAQMMGFPSVEAISPIQWLQHGDSLTLNEYRFEVRHTPGHTPGHVVIYSPDLALVWTGDVLFNGSIGRTDFPQGNFETLMHSIHTQLFTLPDSTAFICGHGPMSTLGHEKQTNPFIAGSAG